MIGHDTAECEDGVASLEPHRGSRIVSVGCQERILLVDLWRLLRTYGPCHMTCLFVVHGSLQRS